MTWLTNSYQASACIYSVLQSSFFFQGALTSLDKSDDAMLQPKQLFFTASGRIGVVLNMGPEISLHMTELQRNMAQVIPSVGGLSHTKYVDYSFGATLSQS
jgi:hypothetical protein